MDAAGTTRRVVRRDEKSQKIIGQHRRRRTILRNVQNPAAESARELPQERLPLDTRAK